MICSQCSQVNPAKSVFCQECGAALQNTVKQSPNLSQEIDDIIFQPNKKNNISKNIVKIVGSCILFIILGISILIVLSPFLPSDSVSEVTAEEELTTFPIDSLIIPEIDSYWSGGQLYLKGILKNNYNKSAKDVLIRVDFYRDENQMELFDTRYITLPGVSYNGAYSFDEPVSITTTIEDFWYVARLEKADFVE